MEKLIEFEKKITLCAVERFKNNDYNQLEGRISQNNKKIYFRTIHAGVLTHILDKHFGVKNIEDA
ncbi:hypothetical protein OAG24_00920 [bacterium]|nr:hypothetical protein [bacterium]